MARMLTPEEEEAYKQKSLNFDKDMKAYEEKKRKELEEGKRQELEEELKKQEDMAKLYEKGMVDDLWINIKTNGRKIQILKKILSKA